MALPLPSPDDAAQQAAREAKQDALLVERVLQGDADAYGELVTRHMRKAFAVAYRLLGHREDAEDAVQDAFIRALERLDRLDRTRPFRPWFFRLVVNQALNARRARTVRATELIPDATPSRTTSPEHDAHRAGLRDRLQAALLELPEKQRLVIQLADLEEFTSAEIAGILDMPDGTVRWHLHQARRALREVLAPMKEET
ncbi:MAG TPA: sigma-70 family RNA polymerase sigma factor [Longimicrobiales bacterium]|nr:sigma-70 family RNA polymerase sigma factor [Longimicrobiales bacterium]